MTTLQELLDIIHRTAVDNQSYIPDVNLFVKSWSKEEEIDENDIKSRVVQIIDSDIEGCRVKMNDATNKNTQNHYYRKIIHLDKLKSKINRL